MFNLERWHEIFEAISKNKLRTFLTGLSIGSGVLILILLLGISDGLKNGIQKQFEDDAATKINFWGSRTSKEYKGLSINRKIELTFENYYYIVNRYIDEIEYKTCRYSKWELTSNYKEKTGNYLVRGVMPGMQFIQNASINAGRFISEKDMIDNRKVVVLGQYVARDFFGDYKNAIGKNITIDNINYKVIGVFSDPGGERSESIMYVPNTNIVQMYSDPTNVGSFIFTLNKEDDFETANNKANRFIDQYTAYLKKSHNVHPNDIKAIQSNNTLEEAKKFLDLAKMINIFFWGVGILTLLAGIVSVSNIMLIVVKERTKEIGIRKALGAQPKAIVGMILHESIFVTSISGFLGLFMGIGILIAISPLIDTPFIAKPWVGFGTGISIVLIIIFAGAIAGFIPARHAAQIKPIIALRDE